MVSTRTISCHYESVNIRSLSVNTARMFNRISAGHRPYQIRTCRAGYRFADTIGGRAAPEGSRCGAGTALSRRLRCPQEMGFPRYEHVVVLMLENRSFDHMLGFLYTGTGNVSPTGQPFEGLTGSESNPGASGRHHGHPDRADHPERLLQARRGPRRGLYGDQRPAIRQHQRAAERIDAAGLRRFRQGLRVHAHLAGKGGAADRAGHRGRRHHGLLHPRGAAGAFRPRQGLRGVRSLVRVRAHRDAAEPRVHLRRDEPGAHGRQDPHLHRTEHLRPARQPRAELGHLRVRRGATDQVDLHRHRTGTRRAHRPVHRLHHRRDGRDAACLHVPGAQLGFERQQPAPQLRRGARRAVHPRRVRGGARRPRLGADAARDHLRRTRRLLRPRATPVGGGPAGRCGGRIRLRVHPVRCPRPHGARVAADRGGHGAARPGGRARRTTTPRSSRPCSNGGACRH